MTGRPRTQKAEESNSAEVEVEIRNFQPRDLINGYDGQLYVRNETNTLVSFDNGKQDGKLKLQQAGKDESIKGLPIEIARHPGFQKFWRAGKVTVTNDPDIELELDRYSEDAIELERLQQTKVNGLIHQPSVTSIAAPFEIQGTQDPAVIR